MILPSRGQRDPREPLGLTREQRQQSDLDGRFFNVADWYVSSDPLLTLLRRTDPRVIEGDLTACPYCRQINGHVSGDRCPQVIEGEWLA